MIWAFLAFAGGVIATLLLGRRFRPTGAPTAESAEVKRAAEAVIDDATQKAKEALDATDDDISRRIDELRAKGRAAGK